MFPLQAYDADPIVIAMVSDLHANSTVGLCPPRVRLDDGGTICHSDFQAKMWACWLDYWQQVERERKDAALVVVVNGDAVDGDHHNTPQIFSRNMETQQTICLQALEPALSLNPDQKYIIRGTEVHVGASAQAEESIARTIGAARTPGGAYSWWELQGDFGGTGFDITHHGPLGRLPWTTGNLLNRLSVEIELSYYRAGLKPPAFAIRSHNHRWGDSGTVSPVRVLSLGCWQGPTGHVHRVAPGATPHVGGLIFRIERGEATFRMVNYSKDVAWI